MSAAVASPRGAFEPFEHADDGVPYVVDADESTSSAFRTPEQQAGGGDAEPARSFAQSHFRRRNRLESRLEELQRDVATLTTKLRAGSTRDASSLAQISMDRSMEVSEPLPTARATKKPLRSTEASARRKNTPSELTTPTGRINRAQSNSVRTLRELHSVTTERDQLRFELDKTKRALATVEKKYQDAKRIKQAYEKLKAHCDSLQDSLELSEKIRVRQKKLLQQLQRQLEGQQATQVSSARKAGPRSLVRGKGGRASPKGRRAKSMERSPGDQDALPGWYEDEEDVELDRRIPRQAREDYDILNSLVSPASTMHRDAGDSRLHEQAEQPASKPTAARSRPKPKASAVGGNPYRSEFDKLLRTERPLQSRYTIQRPRQISTQQRLQEQRAAQVQPRSTRSTTLQSSTRPQQPLTRRKSPANRPKNSFLAPTQASLNRMHQISGRHGEQWRPFVP